MVMGLPAHPLLVHFAIVLLLLAAGAQILAVVLPRFRRWFGWGLPVLGVVAGITVRITQGAGDTLLTTGNVPDSELLAEHGMWGVRTGWAGIALAVITVVYWLLTSEWGRQRLTGRWPSWVLWVVSFVAVAIAVAAIIFVTLAGHTGASSVWG